MVRFLLKTTYKMARRIVVLVVGVSVVVIGVALLVLPGPAFVVIPIGLAILSLEFAWARLWLHKIRDTTSKAIHGKNHKAQVTKEPYKTDYLNHDGP